MFDWTTVGKNTDGVFLKNVTPLDLLEIFTKLPFDYQNNYTY